MIKKESYSILKFKKFIFFFIEATMVMSRIESHKGKTLLLVKLNMSKALLTTSFKAASPYLP